MRRHLYLEALLVSNASVLLHGFSYSARPLTSIRSSLHRASGRLLASAFPLQELTNKEATQSTAFIQANPTYDGRGNIIGIFDTGVDPMAPGLQVTSDSRQKFVDFIDCTGAGDVNTRTIRRADANGFILGLSGHWLRVETSGETHASWENPSGQWRVGLLKGYDIFPAPLVTRVKRQHKEQHERRRLSLLSAAQQQKATSKVGSSEAEEAEAQLTLLEDQSLDDDDVGPLYDVIHWHDGTQWRALLHEVTYDGTNHTSDLVSSSLASRQPMGDFRSTRHVGTLGDDTQLHYTMRFVEEAHGGGCTLSVVTTAGAHGTHVAAIAGAHYPDADSPDKDGLSPGAQMISFKIGDSRLGTMETGQSLSRAFAAVTALSDTKHAIDIINLSYGEPTQRPNHGRLIEMAEVLVRDHGVIFVSSAGNSGPGLSSVTAPGATASALIGIGAYVTKGMKQVLDSMNDVAGDTLQDSQYSFSSRGPSPDGYLGVSLSAPGGAIASVPNWVGQSDQLMKGTSMASPNAVGAISNMLSGLKQAKVEYSPFSVRRVLEATAFRDDSSVDSSHDPFTLGHGLLQVADAFEAHAAQQQQVLNVDFKVSIPERNGAPGIYLRDLQESNTRQVMSASIAPIFPKGTTTDEKVAFGTLLMSVKSTAPWLSSGDHLALPASGRSMSVTIDPRALPPGAHFGELLGFDASADGAKDTPLFRLPVSIVKPHEEEYPTSDEVTFDTLELKSGVVERRFLAVPAGATSMDVSVKLVHRDVDASSGTDGSNEGDECVDTSYWEALDPAASSQSRTVHVHCLTCRPDVAPSNGELKRRVALRPGDAAFTGSLPVEPGTTLEVCVGQDWSSLGPSLAEVEVRWCRVSTASPHVRLAGAVSHAQVHLRNAGVSGQMLRPAARLTSWLSPLRPRAHVVRPLGIRDTFFDPLSALSPGRNDHDGNEHQVISDNIASSNPKTALVPQHELVLEYRFVQPKEGKKHMVMPHLLAAHGEVYESIFTGSMCSLFETQTRRLVGVRDASAPAKHFGPLVAGRQYTLLCQVRHDNAEVLRSMRNMEVWLERPLQAVVPLMFYKDRASAILSQANKASLADANGADNSGSPANDQVNEFNNVNEDGPLITSADAASSTAAPVDKVRRFVNSRLGPGVSTVAYLAGPTATQVPKEAAPGDFLSGDYYLSTTTTGAVGRRFRLTYLVPPKVNAASKGEAALTKSLPGAPLYAPALKKTSPATATNASTAFVATDGDASCSKPAKNEPETAAAGQETVTATIDDNGTINATNTIDDAGDSSDGASMLEAMAIAQLKWQVEWLGKELSKGGDAALHAKAALETIVLQETSRLNHSSEVSSSSSSGNDVAAETGAVSSEQGPIGSDKADAAQAIIAEALLLLLHHESSALARARAASVGDVAPADITAEGSLTTDSTSLGNGTTSSNGSGLVSAPNGDAAAAIDAAVAAVVATAERLASMVDSQALAIHLGQRRPLPLVDDFSDNGNSDEANAAREKAAEDALDKKFKAQKSWLIAARRHQVAALSVGCLTVAAAAQSGSGSSPSALELTVEPWQASYPSVAQDTTPAGSPPPTVPEDYKGPPPHVLPGFLAAVRELAKWEDVGGHSPVAIAVEWRLYRRPGKTLKLANAALKQATSEGRGSECNEEMLRRLRTALYRELGWVTLEAREQRELLSRFPPAPGYRDF